ncbi:MAG TPA: type II secretion system protein [Verrucomicrobiota bacterium]|nr:type II secretion system protein [Verrucomicrobiota bacterium]HNU53290.1 type II secretion system protein [Verrucomicrobiota bacterium]
MKPWVRRSGGFTLLEMVAVLAVLAILGAIIAENVLEQIKMAARQSEEQSLDAIATTLQRSAVRTKAIPSVANLAAAVAADMAMPLVRVQRTAQGNLRWYWMDPNCRVGTNTAMTLPYTQTAVGSVAPVRVRMLALSSVGAPLPERNTGPTSAEFDAAWATPRGVVPETIAAAWNGDSQDFRSQRMELNGLFCRVILENIDAWHVAPFSVETTNTLTSIPPNSRREMWLLSSTVMNFHYNDNSLQAREYIVEDVGYTYENGRWTRYLRYGPNRSIGWFGEMVDRFLAAAPPPNGVRRYSTQQWIIDAMYTFLYDFGQWSLDQFYGGPPWPHIPGYEQASAGASGLANYSSDLLIN